MRDSVPNHCAARCNGRHCPDRRSISCMASGRSPSKMPNVFRRWVSRCNRSWVTSNLTRCQTAKRCNKVWPGAKPWPDRWCCWPFRVKGKRWRCWNVWRSSPRIYKMCNGGWCRATRSVLSKWLPWCMPKGFPCKCAAIGARRQMCKRVAATHKWFWATAWAKCRFISAWPVCACWGEALSPWAVKT